MDCKIDNTSTLEYGFRLLSFDGFLAIEERKSNVDSSDSLTSENSYTYTSFKQSGEATIQLLGMFDTINEREESIFEFYRQFTLPGEKVYSIEGSSTLSLKGIVHKGISADIFSSGNSVLLTIKILKTND